MRSILLAATIVVGMTSISHADTIASGPVFGSTAQGVAVCYIFNASTSNLTVSSIKIIREPDGVALPVVTNNCPPTPFGPGGICRTVSNVSSTNVVACRATVSSKANARGSLEIRNSPNTATLNSQELR